MSCFYPKVDFTTFEKKKKPPSPSFSTKTNASKLVPRKRRSAPHPFSAPMYNRWDYSHKTSRTTFLHLSINKFIFSLRTVLFVLDECRSFLDTFSPFQVKSILKWLNCSKETPHTKGIFDRLMCLAVIVKSCYAYL